MKKNEQDILSKFEDSLSSASEQIEALNLDMTQQIEDLKYTDNDEQDEEQEVEFYSSYLSKDRYKEVLENESFEYLSSQVMPFIGSKRRNLDVINAAILQVKSELGIEKLKIADIFSGSGIVSRLFKQHSKKLLVNDLEYFSYILNKCYLSNKTEEFMDECRYYYDLHQYMYRLRGTKPGFISELYAIKHINKALKTDRAYFTYENAQYIDTMLHYTYYIPDEYKPFVLAPLLVEACLRVNSPSSFKTFYKCMFTGKPMYGGNEEVGLSRIMEEIAIKFPVLSDHECEVEVYNEDATLMVDKIKGYDVLYLDPPYNKTSFSSSYFMLNLIAKNERPEKISKVAGRPLDWNRSIFNHKDFSFEVVKNIITKSKVKYVLLSYNTKGFLSENKILDFLESLGTVTVYNKEEVDSDLTQLTTQGKDRFYLLKKK